MKLTIVALITVTILGLLNYRAYFYEAEEFVVHEFQVLEEDFQEFENRPMKAMSKVKLDTVQTEVPTQAPLDEEVVSASAPATAIGIEFILDWLAGIINSVCGAIGAFFGWKQIKK